MSAGSRNGGRIVVVGPFPPPLHGAAAVTEAMAMLLSRRMEVVRCDNSPGSLVRNAAYHLRRIRRVLSTLATLLGTSRRPGAVYIAAAGGFGLLYDLMCVVAARLRGCRVLIHYHSFAYIDRRSAVMGLLVRLAGAEALHIALCGRMADSLRFLYGTAATCTLSNIAFYPARQTPASTLAGALRLGHMSNLCDEKGLDLVLALHRAAKAEGLPLRLVLAGPAVDAAAARAISAACREFPDSCEYRGPVYGDAKDRFFADVDVFLFPTRYVNEAQPTVLFEAMSHGVPSIAVARGCIVEQLGGAGDAHRAGVVVARAESFIDDALSVLKEWIRSPSSFATAKDSAHRRADFLYAMAATQLESLLAAIEKDTVAP